MMQLDFFKSIEEQEEETFTKHCKVCKEEKPHTIENFHIGSSVASGKVHLKSICRDCNNKANAVVAKLKPKYLKYKTDYCDCCGNHESVTRATLQFDHCYVTNTFRGWLCTSCNRGIGMLGDDIEGVQKAIAYLRRVNERT